ncbi:MAG TPA: two-component regulator propeller domain-containing protein, partial [Rudaea sp.]|nr:two-component regulator propeller domain-containing protein [Rudaea sp.]
VETVRFRNYSTSDGLSQATAMAMAQDTTGFVWIGTQDGLDRFDGYDFKVYRHNRADPWSLADNAIYALAADADGVIWVGTQAGGLDRYDPLKDRFDHFSADPSKSVSLASDYVTALLIDHRGWLWIASTGGKLQWFDQSSQRIHDTPLGMRHELMDVRALVEQADGSVLVGARDGLWRCDSNASRLQEIRFDPQQQLDVRAIATDPRNGDIWVSTTDAGLLRFSAGGKPLAHYFRGGSGIYALPDNEVRGIGFDKVARLWLATKSSGLLRLDSSASGYKQYRHDPTQPQSLAANRQQTVLVSSDGTVWAGSWNNGISMHDPRTQAFATIEWNNEQGERLPAQPVTGLFADKDDTLWFGLSDTHKLIHFDLQSGTIQSYAADSTRPGSLPGNLIEDMKRGRDGSLWVATTGGGLSRLLPGASQFVAYRHDPNDPGSIASDDLLYLMSDSTGTLWIGTVDSGVDELCEGCTTFIHHRHDPANPGSIDSGAAGVILEGSGDTIWIGLRPGGLDRFDRRSATFEHFVSRANDPASLSNNAVTTLMRDRHGSLWIGTQGGGVNHLLSDASGKSRFESISTSDGLAADAIGSIVEDASGSLWLSTTAGISRYDPQTRHILNFGTNEGALARGYYINALARLSDGRIVFGGLSGATLFDPSKVKLPSSPRPIITDVLLNNEPVAPFWRDAESPLRLSPWSANSRVELNYRQNNVSFQFGSLGFSDPEMIEYGYRLDGHDAEWIHANAARRYATYTDLAPGRYLLRVRARRDGDAWNEGHATLFVRVFPAPWFSLPAILGYVVAFLLLVGVIGWRARSNWRRHAQAQKAIRISEERLKYALWGSGGELWDVDLRTGEILRENRLEHLAASHETRAQTIQQYQPFVHPDDLHQFEQGLSAHLKGERDILEISYRSPDVDREWRWLLTRGRVVGRDENGRALRLVGTTQDITVLKRAEESLRKLNEELEARVDLRTADLRRANRELRGTLEQLTLAQRQLLESEKMAALGGLVAGVAHEINTPLGVAVTAASHLQEEATRMMRHVQSNTLDEREFARFQNIAVESAQIILRNLQRADRLIKSFKLVAVDQTTEEQRMIDLGAYLNEILISLGPTLKKKPHRVRVDCAQPISLRTYPGSLYQIVSNLILNSMTHAFTDDQAGEIVITARRSGKLVELQYRDNGNGMSDDVRARIFEPFFTTRRNQGGSGLGLHVVYNLVTQLLRGSIRVESKPGVGTTFEIFLPAELPSQTNPEV